MSLRQNNQIERDMIAVPLQQLIQAIQGQLPSPCCEPPTTNVQSPTTACNRRSFRYYGSIQQLAVCHSSAYVFQVPSGEVGTITQVSLAERYPGTLYGANFMILVNGAMTPQLPRIDSAVDIETQICLEEQDTVEVVLQCSWTPASFTGIAATYIQTLFPFALSGFFEDKI